MFNTRSARQTGKSYFYQQIMKRAFQNIFALAIFTDPRTIKDAKTVYCSTLHRNDQLPRGCRKHKPKVRTIDGKIEPYVKPIVHELKSDVHIMDYNVGSGKTNVVREGARKSPTARIENRSWTEALPEQALGRLKRPNSDLVGHVVVENFGEAEFLKQMLDKSLREISESMGEKAVLWTGVKSDHTEKLASIKSKFIDPNKNISIDPILPSEVVGQRVFMNPIFPHIPVKIKAGDV